MSGFGESQDAVRNLVRRLAISDQDNAKLRAQQELMVELLTKLQEWDRMYADEDGAEWLKQIEAVLADVKEGTP